MTYDVSSHNSPWHNNSISWHSYYLCTSFNMGTSDIYLMYMPKIYKGWWHTYPVSTYVTTNKKYYPLFEKLQVTQARNLRYTNTAIFIGGKLAMIDCGTYEQKLLFNCIYI